MTRFPPLADAEWPEEIADMRSGFAGGLNVYRTMAHHPALLRAWAPLRAHVVVDTALGPERSEVVILRTGTHLGSSYEWDQHVSRSRKLGIADARILSLRGPVEEMADEDATLCTAVDELFTDHRIAPATMEAVIALVGTGGLFDLMATVGFYSTLGFLLNTCDTPLDDDIAQGLAANPLPKA